jgi:hypothetical protein
MGTRAKLDDYVHIIGIGDENVIVTFDKTVADGEYGFECTFKDGMTGDMADGSNTVSNVSEDWLAYRGRYVVCEEAHDRFDAAQAATNVYRITSSAGGVGGTVTLDKDSGGTTAGAWLRLPIVGVVMRGFTIDGTGGVDGLVAIGGPPDGYIAAHVFDIQYCVFSEFEALLINAMTDDSGGTGTFSLYNGVHNYYCKVGNIKQCKIDGNGDDGVVGFHLSEIHHIDGVTVKSGAMVADCIGSHIHHISGITRTTGGSGGAVEDCDYCTIEDIRRCESPAHGGGVYNCDYATILRVRDCKAASDGGGVAGCDNSVITDVTNCVALSDGGGVADCDNSVITNVVNCVCGVNGQGGGIFDCDYCTITHVEGCGMGNGTGTGGGLAQCNYCTITKVIDCSTGASATQDGGGLYQCDYCKVSHVRNCFAGRHGGGLYDCDNCEVDMVVDCTAFTGDGGGLAICNDGHFSNIVDCEATTGRGGGLATCLDSVISNVRGCSAATGGGGLYGCARCTIQGVHDNSVSSSNSNGGGLEACTNCFISNVNGNTVNSVAGGTATGGGAADCHYSIFSGNWLDNDDIDGSKNDQTWHNCATSLGTVIYRHAGGALTAHDVAVHGTWETWDDAGTPIP